ncbi:MAG: hypothetical protein H6658_03400 [Ardenticatenaceae bacterium]|nr:hypothetical protein [Ardenticatenaceae bacterium]
MRRLPSLLLIVGTVLILTGLTFALLLMPLPTATAALPPNHPTLHPQTSNARVPTTRQDFFLPGTQPGQIQAEIIAPENCTFCHGDGYSQQTIQPAGTETWSAWFGSMMAQAGRDPLFYAALDIANADAAFSGDFCLRCHVPRGWLDARHAPTSDTSNFTPDDLEGVQCEVCHRMVDPFYTNENPARDLEVLAAITAPVTFPGNASIIVDPLDHRRGPLNVTDTLGFDPHLAINISATLQSPYHTESLLCGSCHNIDNPVFSWDETTQSYQLNPLGQASDLVDPFPIERTFSEWALSSYNTPGGIYAPQFGGNNDYVSTCQDCHMRAITGTGGIWPGQPNTPRPNYPLHDLTGANTWVPQILPLHPVFSSTYTGTVQAEMRAQALISGTLRARYMLQNAATLAATKIGDTLVVTVTNQSGHKLPSGYVEGRRMWLQVEGYDINGTLVYTSGAYNVGTADLSGYHTDPTLKVYESLHGLSPDLAAQLGLEVGHSFHFVLNNVIICDNRIPPRGYDFAAFAEQGAAPYANGRPSSTLYANEQYWDTTLYNLPSSVVTGTVRLMHQVASKEYIEFLRDNNPNPAGNNGDILYDLWEQTERSRPEIMAAMDFTTSATSQSLPDMRQLNSSYPAICDYPLLPTAVTLSGPLTGTTHTAYSFQANLLPLTTTLPLSYTWMADGQTTTTHLAWDTSDNITYTWPLAGSQTITLTASNGVNQVTATHTITLTAPDIDNRLYLPFITRSN